MHSHFCQIQKSAPVADSVVFSALSPYILCLIHSYLCMQNCCEVYAAHSSLINDSSCVQRHMHSVCAYTSFTHVAPGLLVKLKVMAREPAGFYELVNRSAGPLKKHFGDLNQAHTV